MTDNSPESSCSPPRRDRTMIVVRNAGGRGKTRTLRALAELLLQRATPDEVILLDPENFPANRDWDVRLVVNFGETVVAVESQGDPHTGIEERLERLADLNGFNADLIFCSCRTSGGTTEAVESVAARHGFQIIWVSTYQSNVEELHPRLNQSLARHLLDLGVSLGFLQ